MRRASIAASIGLALTLAATLGYIGWPRVATAFGSKPAPRPPAYAVGETVDVPAAWYIEHGHVADSVRARELRRL